MGFRFLFQLVFFNYDFFFNYFFFLFGSGSSGSSDSESNQDKPPQRQAQVRSDSEQGLSKFLDKVRGPVGAASPPTLQIRRGWQPQPMWPGSESHPQGSRDRRSAPGSLRASAARRPPADRTAPAPLELAQLRTKARLPMVCGPNQQLVIMIITGKI